MPAPLDISKFNALLHSKENRPDLVSALSELTTIRDLDILHELLIPMSAWGHW